jgi:hypothetical protein
MKMLIACAGVLALAACQPVNEGAGGSTIYASCVLGAATSGSPTGAGSSKGYTSCVTIVTASSPTTSTPTNTLTIPVSAAPAGALP